MKEITNIGVSEISRIMDRMDNLPEYLDYDSTTTARGQLTYDHRAAADMRQVNHK